SGTDGGREEEEPAGRRDGDVREARGSEGLGRLVRRSIHHDHGELPAVGEAPKRPTVGGNRIVVNRPGLWVRQRVDEGEPAARCEPASGELEEIRGPVPVDMAEPEPGEQAAGRIAVGLRPRVADMEMRAEAVGQQPVAGAFEGGGGRVVAPKLALLGEERRPPAGAGREL